MSDYPYRLLRPGDEDRGDALQAIIARNIGPRVGARLGPLRGRLRSARVEAVSGLPRGGGLERSIEVSPFGDPVPAPAGGTRANPLYVASAHYGATNLVFNFQGATSGGGGNNEIRVSPYLDFAHLETKSLLIVPYSGVQPGQFIQVLKAGDDNITNSATPSGTIIGQQIGRLGDYPTPDNSRGIPVPNEALLFDTFRVGWSEGAYIKVRLFFVAPATSLPIISVHIPVVFRHGPTPGLFAARS